MSASLDTIKTAFAKNHDQAHSSFKKAIDAIDYAGLSDAE